MVSVSNYLSIKETIQSFPERGLVYVQGDVGSGKTALGEAIAQAMFGVGSRYSRAIKRVGDSGKGFSIKTQGLLGESELSVYNGYKLPWCTGEGLYWESNSSETKYPDLDTSREKLSQMLGISAMEARWCVFLDGENMRWDQVPQTEATQFLMSLFKTPNFSSWRDSAKKKCDDYDRQLSRQGGLISGLKAIIAELGGNLLVSEKQVNEDIAAYSESIEATKQDLSRNEAEILDLELKLKSIEAPSEAGLNSALLAVSKLSKDKFTELELKIAKLPRSGDPNLAAISADLEVRLSKMRSYNDGMVKTYCSKSVAEAEAALEKAKVEVEKSFIAVAQSRHTLSSLKSDRDKYESRVNTLAEKLRKIKDCCPTCGLNFVGENLEKAVTAKQSVQEDLSKAEIDLQAIEIDLKKAAEINAEKEEAVKKSQDIKAKRLASRDKALAEAKEEKATYEEELRREEISLAEAVKVANVNLQLSIKEQITVINSYEEKLESLKEEYDANLARLNAVVDAERKILELDPSAQRKQAIEVKIVELKSHGKKLARDLELTNNALIKTNSKLEQNEQVKQSIAKKNSELEQLIQENADIEFIYQLTKYWHHACGPQGMPNMVLEDIIPSLNAHSQTISEELVDGSIRVVWSAIKQKASGEDSAKLSWTLVDKLGEEIHAGTSKGESSAVRFMISSTLTSCASTTAKCNWRWYDEVTAGQNPRMFDATLNWMKRKAQEEDMLIFIVDHNKDTIKYADYVLKTEKIDNATMYKWA